MKKKTTKRIDSGAPERGPLAIEKDGLGELLAERALQTATSGDEPAEYNEDDAADLADTDPGIVDADEDDFEPPQRRH